MMSFALSLLSDGPSSGQVYVTPAGCNTNCDCIVTKERGSSVAGKKDTVTDFQPKPGLILVH
jgi:hypothetical protein